MSTTIQAIGNDGSTFNYDVELRELAQSEKIMLAAKWFGVFFLIAVVTAFIPILHFVLVPGSLIVGIAMAAKSYMKHSVIGQGDIKCPSCGADASISGMDARFPIKMTCESCRKQYRVSLA